MSNPDPKPVLTALKKYKDDVYKAFGLVSESHKAFYKALGNFRFPDLQREGSELHSLATLADGDDVPGVLHSLTENTALLIAAEHELEKYKPAAKTASEDASLRSAVQKLASTTPDVKLKASLERLLAE